MVGIKYKNGNEILIFVLERHEERYNININVIAVKTHRDNLERHIHNNNLLHDDGDSHISTFLCLKPP